MADMFPLPALGPSELVFVHGDVDDLQAVEIVVAVDDVDAARSVPGEGLGRVQVVGRDVAVGQADDAAVDVQGVPEGCFEGGVGVAAVARFEVVWLGEVTGQGCCSVLALG